MKNGLNRHAPAVDDNFEKVPVNVFDISTKQIVFTGSIREVANFIGASVGNARQYLKTKSRYKKKYALRYAKAQS